jgi:hypothetical protein
MKSTKDNTLEVLSFIVIAAVAVALTYEASLIVADVPDSSVWGRLIAVPMMMTLFVFAPTLPPGYVVIGWMGSLVIYAAIGVTILLLIQKTIKKYGGKGGGPRI